MKVETVFRKDQSHGVDFLHAHAVFPRNRASQGDTGFHNLLSGLVDSPYLVGIAGVEQQQGVEVSVAGVEDIPVRDRVSCGDGGNLGQRIREPCAGHGAVGHEIVGGQPGNGAERPAPSRPKQVPLCGVLRLTDLAAAVLHAQLADPFGLLLQPRCRSIHLGNQHGGCV